MKLLLGVLLGVLLLWYSDRPVAAQPPGPGVPLCRWASDGPSCECYYVRGVWSNGMPEEPLFGWRGCDWDQMRRGGR